MSLPTALSKGTGESLERYMAEVNKHPLLTRDEERELAETYLNEGRVEAAHKLVVSNLRFVVKIAHEFRGYGLKLLDLIQEGNVGLMVAVKKFNPARGYRLITYAVWWIRAYIQGFVLRSWSLVRIGTSRAQRKLFFRLRGEQAKALRKLGADTSASVLNAQIAERMNLQTGDVEDMASRLSARDFSLDNPVGDDAQVTHLDYVAEGGPDQEASLQQKQDIARMREAVREVSQELNEKERHIVVHRLLSDDPDSLQAIGETYSISRERVRQLENRVKKKLRCALEAQDQNQA